MMMNYALVYFLLAVVSGVVGFSGWAAGESAIMARALCMVSLALAMLAMMTRHTARRP